MILDTEPYKILSKDILQDELYSGECGRIIEEAEQMINGRFVFNNVWDMEPCDEYVDNASLRWDIMYKGDREWTYMFTRFDYSFKLIIAYEVTKDLKYINYGLKWIDTWYKDNAKFLLCRIGKVINKLDGGRNLAHRTLDVAILAANIADYSKYCFNNRLITKAIHKKHRKIVESICKYVFNTDREFKTLTNWGPIENGYILYASEVFDLNFHKEELVTRMQTQVNLQIRLDGSHTESSPMYLVEVLLPLMKCMRFCRSIDLKMISEAVQRGCEYLRCIETPDFSIPNIGDSDLVNISDLMIIAFELFNDKKYLAAINRKLTIEYLYKYRMNSISQKQILGYYWEKDDRLELQHQAVITDKELGLFILCSNIPYGPSGHKHCDFLSLVLYINNKPVLIDGGRETYKDSEIRGQSKSPISHNTVAINGEDYWKIVDAWKTKQSFSEHIIKRLDNDSVLMSCILGECEIRITRVVTYINNKGIIVTDLVEGNCYKKYQAFFNLAPNLEIVEKDNKLVIQNDIINLYYGNTLLNTSLKEGRCSFRYNTGNPNKRIVCDTTSTLATHYFMFGETTITHSYKNGILEYYYADTQHLIKELKLH